jgi:hypothetical protein
VGRGEAADAGRCGDETEEADARRARALQRGDRGDRAPAGGEHRVEEEEVSLGGIARDLEVVVHGLERVVIAVQSDVADARRGDEAQHPLHHPQPRAQDRHERQLLPADAPPRRRLERRLHRHGLERQLARRLVRHQHRELVDELLEDLRRRPTVAQQRQLVLHERMPREKEGGVLGGGVHGREASIFAPMKEYQAVIVRLTRLAHDDEDALTDLLNERSRGGWEPAMMTQEGARLTIVFQRDGGGER